MAGYRNIDDKTLSLGSREKCIDWKGNLEMEETIEEVIGMLNQESNMPKGKKQVLNNNFNL